MSSTQPTNGAAPKTAGAADIEAEIARTRAELRATVDQLSERLNPKNQAQRVADEAKIAFADVSRKVTGQVRPADEPEPTRTGWIALGAGAGVAALLVVTVLRKL